ncbi:MAG: Mu-like prophage major head subunit gpT family protein [Kiritimatiellia bacterium]|jgi:phage major head subunit gpT-like protein
MIPTRANCAAIFRGFRATFNNAYNAQPDARDAENLAAEDFAMSVPSTNTSEDHLWLGQLPVFRKWVGSRVIHSLQIGRIIVVNEPYEATVGVPVPAIEDDSYGLFGPVFSAMGNNARDLWRRLAVQALLANAVWADGNRFFCANRVLADGAERFTNATTAAFGDAALEAAAAALRSAQLGRDQSANVLPRLLIVGPSNAAKARRILKGEIVASAAGTASESNPLKGLVDFRVCNDLVGSHAGKWFLMGEVAGIRGVCVQKRKEPALVAKNQPTDDNVFLENEALFGADGRGEAFLTLPFLAYAGGLAAVDTWAEQPAAPAQP